MARNLRLGDRGGFEKGSDDETMSNTSHTRDKREVYTQKYQHIVKSSSMTDNLNYDLYKYTARYIETNRIHKDKEIEVVIGDNPVEIIRSLGYEYPKFIQKIDFPRPSDAQQNYYYNLTKEYLPKNASKVDASALISRYCVDDEILEKDIYSPNPALVEYATKKKIKFSYYIGKKHLYDLIFYSLEKMDKIIFYIYCVYRDRLNKKGIKISGNPLALSEYRLFYEFAKQKINDSSYVNSILKTDGYKLRYFGEYTLPNGSIVNGCSVNTIAYKKTISFLKENNLI